MGESIDLGLRKRIINSIYALSFLGALLLLSVLLEYLPLLKS
jgi:hypothetical protein